MFDADTTIRDFLAATAAKQPTPGGGSVTALAGALAAAIGEMVVNYSAGRKGLESHADAHRDALARLTRARAMLLELMVEDQVAYDAMTSVRKLPADSPEKASRHEAAVLACIRVPQAMAAAGAALLDLADGLVDRVNPWLLSDLAVCAHLAMATVHCGLANVRVNLRDVIESADRSALEKVMDEQRKRADDLLARVIPRIWARDAQGR